MGLGSILRSLLPGGTASGAGSSGAAPAIARGHGSDGVPARPSGSWRALPPIQRTVGSAPLVAPNASFKAGLAAARPAPTALAPLRHEHGLQAPAGLVAGIATPVQRATDPVPATVRRPPGAARSGSVGGAAAGPAAGRLADTSTSESGVWPAFGVGADAGAPAGAEPAPIRQAPVVARVADTGAAGTHPLVRAPLGASVPGGRVGGRPAPAVERRAEVAAPAALAGPIEPATALPATAESVAGAAAAKLVPAPSPVETSVARSLDAPRPNLGQSRRLRVGAAITPVSGAPLAVHRSTAARADHERAATGLPARPGPARPASPGVATALPDPLAARELGSAAVHDGDVPEMLLTATESGVATQHAYPAPGVSASVPLRTLAVARSADLPLVGTLKPHVSPASPAVAVRVQAEADDELGGDEATPSAALAALARVDSFAGIGPTGPAFGAPSALFPHAGSPGAGHPGAIPVAEAAGVARSIASPSPAGPGPGSRASTRAFSAGGSVTRGAGPAVAHMPAAATQRTMSWDPVSGMTTSSVPAPEPGPVALPVVAASGATTSTSGVPALPAIAPLVARAVDDAGSDTRLAPVQREEAAAAPAGEGGGAGAPATGAGAMPEAQLDDLARRLHDRIAARLGRDLLIERERSGSLIDRGW